MRHEAKKFQWVQALEDGSIKSNHRGDGRGHHQCEDNAVSLPVWRQAGERSTKHHADAEQSIRPTVHRHDVSVHARRAVIVTANADLDRVEPTLVVAAIEEGFVEQLREEYPDVKLELGGTSKEEQKFVQKLMYMLGITLFAIYALMAIPLKSYLQPLIIMGVIPFGMIGALIGHIILGLPFSFLSVFGIVALSGVVVNDSLIMVDFVNRGVDEGMDLENAAVQAGTQRIRAILLTSLTTFFGLLPMLLETSLTAQMVLPMAVSLGFGILFATGITLFLIPCLYVVLVDVDRSRNVFTATNYEAVLQHEKRITGG